MATDAMSVRLHLKRLRVTRVLVDEINRLEVEVADTRSVVRCPFCEHKSARVHETRRVLVQDLPLGRPTTLVWLQRRFECADCGQRHSEDHPEFEGKVTRRLARQLVRDAKHLTIRELSRRHRLSWHFIMGLVRDWSGLVGQQRRESRCRVLLVDETSLRRRHRYVTVLLDGETGAVLGMVKHRDANALNGSLVSKGHRLGRRSCRRRQPQRHPVPGSTRPTGWAPGSPVAARTGQRPGQPGSRDQPGCQ